MLNYIRYLINFVRLFLSPKSNYAFDFYDYNSQFQDPKALGIIDSDEVWLADCPSLKQNENLSITASNSTEQTALNLKLKWRPHVNGLVTVLTQFSLELEDLSLDFDHATTHRPTTSALRTHLRTVEEYCSKLSPLKLYIIEPFTRYRLTFTGYMRDRLNATDEPHFVKLNLLIHVTSKPIDFKNQLSESFIAEQATLKASKCGLFAAKSLISQDRHDIAIHAKGTYSVTSPSTNATRTGKLFTWGFYGRQLIDLDNSPKVRSKRLLAYFASGRAFNIGCIESTDTNFDKNQRMDFGFALMRGPKTFFRPFDSFSAQQFPNWDKLASDSRDIDKFTISLKSTTMQVTATRRSASSQFFAATTTDNCNKQHNGWIYLAINDSLDDAEDVRQVRRSREDFEASLDDGTILDARALEQFERACQSTESRPLVVCMAQNSELNKCALASFVGAKASSLALMQIMKSRRGVNQQSSFEVPNAIVLTRFAYEAIQQSNEEFKSYVSQLSAQVGRGNLSDVETTCKRLQALITDEDSKLPQQLLTELKTSLKQAFSIADMDSMDGKSFAVRSSSWGEDEEGMSAAGQLSTCLNVRTFDKLLHSIKVCFASKFSHTNIEYKRQHGLPLDMPMAVVVQEMVACDKAGVLFTCEPTTGNGRFMTITANYGLGETVVSAAADPDTIVVDVQSKDSRKHMRIVSKQIGTKKVIIEAQSDSLAENGTSTLDAANKENFNSQLVEGNSKQEEDTKAAKEDKEQQQEKQPITPTTANTRDTSICCLTDDEIYSLAEIGTYLRRFFQNERDIEFGFKDSTLYLLQSRPVTGLESLSDYELLHSGDTPSRAEVDYLTRANIGEVMPYPMMYLTYSHQVQMWGVVAAKLMHEWSKLTPEEYSLKCKVGVRFDSMHAFFSLIEGDIMPPAQPGQEKPLITRALEIGLFGHEVEDEEISAAGQENVRTPNKHEKFWFELRSFKIRYYPMRTIQGTRKLLEQVKNDISANRYIKSHSMSQLYELVCLIPKFMQEPWTDFFSMILIVSEANFILLTHLAKHIHDPKLLFTTLSRFLELAPNIVSAQIPARIESMANEIKKRGAFECKRFSQLSAKDGLKYVTSKPSVEVHSNESQTQLIDNSSLARMFDEFIDNFGHRCYAEMEYAMKPWREDPEKIIDDIKSNCMSAEIRQPKKKQTVDEVIDSLNLKLSYRDRQAIKKAVSNSHCYVTAREHTKNNIVYFVDLQRRVLNMFARELRKQNRIPDESLIYFFDFRDLQFLVEAPQPALVMAALRRQRMFRTIFKQDWRFNEIIKGREAIPLHLIESTQSDREFVKSISGTTACAGRATGIVCIVENYKQLNKVVPNCILVVHSTDIAFSPVYPVVDGLITEVGGLISHGAVVAREYGLPCIIGVTNATKILKDGQRVVLDADKGLVLIK